MMLVLAEKLRLGPLFAVALVAIPAKLGYLASVTNPLPLVIAQPIVGVPVFSGAGFRLVMWVVFLGAGHGATCCSTCGAADSPVADEVHTAPKLSARHVAILLAIGLGIVAIVYGAGKLHWGNPRACRVLHRLGVLIAVIGGMDAEHAAEAFVDGMKSMMLAALLVGLAGAVEVVLRNSLVLDTIINDLAALAQRPRADRGGAGAGGDRDHPRRADPVHQRQGGDLDADPVADRATDRRVRADDGAGVSDRQRTDQHGDADVGDAAGVSGDRARAVRHVDALHPAAVAACCWCCHCWRRRWRCGSGIEALVRLGR